VTILSRKGVNLEMSFRCCDCGDLITGQQVINGEYLYIVAANWEIPEASVFRCECCQDEYEESRHE
jgi:hypothetical protein